MQQKLVALAFLVFAIVAVDARAQPNGGLIFSTDSLNAFASRPELSVFVAAQRSQTPAGTSGFAVLNIFDFTTYQFMFCSNANFDVTFNVAGAALSFTTEGGFNCPVGVEVLVTCDTTAESAVIRNVINGTARLGAFDQQYTTHGTGTTLNNLSCGISAFGSDLAGNGSASKTRQLTTP